MYFIYVCIYICHENFEQIFNPSSVINEMTDRQTERVKFPNNTDPDEVAHYEPSHLDLHCLPSSLRILNMI